MSSLVFIIFLIGVAIFLLAVILFFFEPGLAYRIRKIPAIPAKKEEFSRLLEAVAGSSFAKGNRIEVLNNGEVFYEAELDAIRSARRHVHLEAYIFERGKLTDRFIEVLTDRAKAGVEIRLVLDAVGSVLTPARYFRKLVEAGGRVEFYHPLRWYLLARFNNRTHREILIVDGTLAFVGGAGFADCWIYGRRREQRWRDMVFRVQGDVVRGLQSIFTENWLEASGEILLDEELFPRNGDGEELPVMAVGSSPSAGRSTRARMLFQTLITSARKSIFIISPYFLPDQGARRALVSAVMERGVDVKIITPNRKTDHLLIRATSRRLYGELLQAGIVIAEYQPAMIHTKMMIIDELWSVIGSTNFDYRSFGINDEVNLVVCDRDFAARLCENFLGDLGESRTITYETWRNRPMRERIPEWLGWVLEKQQ